MGVIEALKAAAGEARRQAVSVYRQAIGGGEVDEQQALQAVQQLGKTEDAIERDAGIVARARILEAQAARLPATEQAYQQASAKAMGRANELREKLREIETLLLRDDPEGRPLRAAVDRTRGEFEAAQRASQELAQLRAAHPELLG